MWTSFVKTAVRRVISDSTVTIALLLGSAKEALKLHKLQTEPRFLHSAISPSPRLCSFVLKFLMGFISIVFTMCFEVNLSFLFWFVGIKKM